MAENGDRPDRARRRLLQATVCSTLAASLLPPALRAAPAGCTPWASWTSFVARHIDGSGRVIDFANVDQRSTSEGQSYALFFALVNNDPELFERLLSWTRRNLCGDAPEQRLPAWLWGHAGDGQWRVLDQNSASDADLWIAYALIEAGRLWQRPAYANAGLQLLHLVRKQEVAELPGLGPMLLPGRQGFTGAGRWLLNPSYLPLQLLRRFAEVDPNGPWPEIATSAARLLRESATAGFAPDWIGWDGNAFVIDPAKGKLGSYDAIRVYLWAGMLDAKDPLRAGLLAKLSGPLRRLEAQGRFAEKIDSTDGVGTGQPPAGFAAALLPYLSALRQPALLQAQRQLIPEATQPAAAQLPYYERMLVLFGQGWLEHRYRFSADGRLTPGWRSNACSART